MTHAGALAWWSRLEHSGLVLSPIVLGEFLAARPGGALPSPTDDRLRALRRAWHRFETDPTGQAFDWLDAVLAVFLHHGGALRKRDDLPPTCFALTEAGQRLAPHRALLHDGRPAFLVRLDRNKRVGVHGGRRDYGRFVELLRRTGCPAGLLTNGRQWRLVWAGPDADAWAQWEAAGWFEEGGASETLRGFQALLEPRALSAVGGEEIPLHRAVRESRTRQGELSPYLGEQVRSGVERILRGVTHLVDGQADLSALYQAATRVVMRLVVLFFAESGRRELLPRDMPGYDDHYGVEGLLAQLRLARADAGPDALAERHGAWPRLLALFRLIHGGGDLSAGDPQGCRVFAYGGELFRPGRDDSDEPILRALALLESPAARIDDFQVLELLRGLKYTEIRVRRGRHGEKIPAPVEFGDLSTEYVGILYEGLLDFELRRVHDDEEAMVRLRIGLEPYLPLRLLRQMSDAELADLIGTLSKEKAKGPQVAEEAEAAEEVSDEPEPEEASEEEPADEPEEEDPLPEEGAGERLQREVLEWASRAAEAAGLVRRPRGRRAELEDHAARVRREARKLVGAIHAPGEFYLVRWGGTRKGSGTFYTKPSLALPTIRRTLEPFCYVTGADGALVPRSPEEILALRVCDPACGSGSFLVGALRYLADALARAVERRIAAEPGRSYAEPYGRAFERGLESVERPLEVDGGSLTDTSRARLKRYVAQRCLFGVDLNPLAVELARVSLWIETLDKGLPFEFFAHHVKRGNALVGAWLDQIEDYPLAAWEREAGDGAKGAGTKALKAQRKDVKAQMLRQVQRMALARLGHRQDELFAGPQPPPARAVVEEALEALEDLQKKFPVHDPDARENHWREHVRDNPHLRELRRAFDRWCAVWFWPVAAAGGDRWPIPDRFYGEPATLDDTAQALRDDPRHRFFHWELEFPEVFCRETPGFDAVVGNPPWDIQKPNSQEFFSNYDPIYRTYGKQDAIRRQQELCARDPAILPRWEDYCARFKAFSNWVRSASDPWSGSLGQGKAAQEAAGAWERIRGGRDALVPSPHPFQHQGSADLNSYKLFLEQAHMLLREGGRLGLLVPSGIYTDKGCTALRDLFLDRSRWEWIYGFENRRKIFEIHRSFKFCPLIVEKSPDRPTEAIRAAFMRHDPADWERADPPHLLIRKEQIHRFSPRTSALLEIQSSRDLEILEKIYANSVLLGDDSDDGWKIRYATEFHMTNDSKLFPPRPQWEAKGYRPDEYSRWLLGPWRPRAGSQDAPADAPRHTLVPGIILSRDGTHFLHESEIQPDPESGKPGVALPLYQGVMFGQYDFSPCGWVSGTGLRARWEDTPWESKRIAPQFLMAETDAHGRARSIRGAKPVVRRVARNTDIRTVISAVVPDMPCGDLASVAAPEALEHRLALAAFLNSFSADWIARRKVGGTHLDQHLLWELPLGRSTPAVVAAIGKCVLSLNCSAPIFGSEWLPQGPVYRQTHRPWPGLWALADHERLRLRCILDAVAVALYGLSFENALHILRDCDHPASDLGRNTFSRSLDPKGFWRVDQDKDPELRLPVLALAAFSDLQSYIASCGGDRPKGIESFLAQNGGEGWMLPETLRLADINLGHDERARHPQPVRERLGERFFPWQLHQGVEESWKECELHARNLLGEEGFKRLQDERPGQVL